jgi:hypothetical protein
MLLLWMLFLGVTDGVTDDVSDMLVGQVVSDLAGPAGGRDQPHVAQHPQVLREQRLAHGATAGSQGVGQLVHAPGPDGQLHHDGKANRRGNGLEQLDRSRQRISPWRSYR